MSRKKKLISELNLKNIGGRIAFIRLINNQTSTEFCEKTGISKGNLSGLENHKYDPSFQAIVKILDIYHVNSDWLLSGEGEPFIEHDTEEVIDSNLELSNDYEASILDEELFKNELRDKVINLLDSERGLQAKLSKAVGKPSSFFSALKSGNPVNATHLKAIGIVFGANYVNFLLGIGNIPENEQICFTDENIQDGVTADPVINDHIEIVKKFKHKEIAKKINESLLIIDNQNLNKFEDLEYLIKGVARGMDYEYRLYRPNSAANQSENFTVLNNHFSEGNLKNGTEE